VRIPGTSHFLHAEQPARILELVTEWIQGQR
jgi:pimeloyl-ACP methyl ester carboxylesterase